MKKWSAYYQFNEEDITHYITMEFPVSDKLYDKIQKAIANNIPLKECDFYPELTRRAGKSFNLADYIDCDIEEPQRDDYAEDEKEQYEEDLEAYQDEIEEFWDSFSEEDSGIFDPGEEKRFKEKFIGKTFPLFDGEEGHTLEFNFTEDSCRYVEYYLSVEFGKSGKILSIGEIRADALEWEGVRSSGYGECHPDYEFLEEQLADELGEEDEDCE